MAHIYDGHDMTEVSCFSCFRGAVALRLMLTSLSSNLRRPHSSEFWASAAMAAIVWFESTLLGCCCFIGLITYLLSYFLFVQDTWSIFGGGCRFLGCLGLLCNCCVDGLVASSVICQEFEERWNDKSIPGWQEPTHKAGPLQSGIQYVRFFCHHTTKLHQNQSKSLWHTHVARRYPAHLRSCMKTCRWCLRLC